MQQRIVGTELEYSAALRDALGEEVPVPQDNKYFLPHIPQEYAGLGDRLKNGSRLYMDVGNHPEYAASEDDSIIGSVANEIVGDEIVYATMQAIDRARRAVHARSTKRTDGIFGFHLGRRVVDHAGGGWGYHENYSCDRETYKTRELNDFLAFHLVTRSVYAGAGTLTKDGSFALAQKATLVTEFAEASTVKKKALILTRDEPHADHERFARISVVCGDPHMSPWSTWMQLGTTALVIDMFEHGFAPKDMRLRSGTEARVARQVATDLTLKQTFEQEKVKTITAIDAQWEIYAAGMEMSRELDIGSEKRAILAELERTLTVLEDDPMKLRDRAEWPARLRDHERYMDKHGLKEGAQELFTRDYKWTSRHPSGTGMILRKLLWIPWMPDAELVEERLTHGAQTTRAGVRSRFMAGALARGLTSANAKADWVNLETRNGVVSLLDPFVTEDSRVDALLDHIALAA